jgi:hypothetical protein
LGNDDDIRVCLFYTHRDVGRIGHFADTAQCSEWFVADAIRASVDLFVINGDLTTYKATIKERNFWIDRWSKWPTTLR